MPRAKFCADMLKTVAVHKEQRNTDRPIQFCICKEKEKMFSCGREGNRRPGGQ